jgi:predicted nucleic acid-binding protein
VTTLYLDTSSLLKIYVDEEGSEEVRQELAEYSSAATSSVTYAEARSAFARRRRDGTLTAAVFRAVKRDLDADWPQYVVVEATAGVCRAAGELAERYALRGFDSLHLATCLQIAQGTRPGDVGFSSFDQALSRAAASALRSVYRRSRV